MGVSATEQSILKVVAGLRQATKSQIIQQTGLSTGYTDYLCKYLVRGGYLKFLSPGRYALAPEGQKRLVSLGWEVKIDAASIKSLASQVAKEVSQTIKTTGGKKEVTKEIIKERYVRPEEERKKIDIKTDYILPVADETVGLETNIGKIGSKTEKEGGESFDASVELFKNLKKSKRKK